MMGDTKLTRQERQPDMSPEERAEARKRCDAATKEPWHFQQSTGRDCIWMDVVAGPHDDDIFSGETHERDHVVNAAYRHALLVGKQQAIANCEFVAHARTDLPKALDALDAKDREIERLREALKCISEAETDGVSESVRVAEFLRLQQIATKALANPGAGGKVGAQ